MDIMAMITLAAKIGTLALQVGRDAAPFFTMISEWSSGDKQPTTADFDKLNAMEQPFLDILNDRSKDVT